MGLFDNPSSRKRSRERLGALDHDPIRDIPQVIERPLSGGLAGNYETTEYMKGIVKNFKGNPLVRRLAMYAVQGLASHAYVDEALSIGRFVQKNVRYVQDPPALEQLTTPDTLADQILRGRVAQGDCDDMALLIATMLASIGHEPLFRMVRYHGSSGPFQHIYVVDYVKADPYSPKARVVLDAIMKDRPMGSEIPHESGEEVPAEES